MNYNAPPIPMFDKDIAFIIEEFLNLLGKEDFVKKRLSKRHRFYPLLEYYFLNKGKDWSILEIPKSFYRDINAIGNFVVVLKNILLHAGQGKPLMRFFKVDYIDTLCIEAEILSEYLRRGCIIKWSSLFGKDPPDLVIRDVSGIEVDLEVKIKDTRGTIESMFNSLSKGLQSLKKRKGDTDKPAVIVVHNQNDLGWEDWLNSSEVQQKIASRLKNPEYSIVSGMIFSGGERIICQSDGCRLFTARHLDYTSLVAKYKLPEGFLASARGL